MTNEIKEIDHNVEHAPAVKSYAPRVDIVETDDNFVIQADMPGVSENSIDITLEKNVLSINGHVEPAQPDNYKPIYAEYEAANYQRSFTLSDMVARDNIEASVKDGVLNLTLPKAAETQPRKIAVHAA